MPFGPRSFRTRATGPRARPAFLSHGATADSIRVYSTTTAVGARPARRPSGIRPAPRPARARAGKSFPQPVTASPPQSYHGARPCPISRPPCHPGTDVGPLLPLDGLVTRAKGDVAGQRAPRATLPVIVRLSSA